MSASSCLHSCPGPADPVALSEPHVQTLPWQEGTLPLPEWSREIPNILLKAQGPQRKAERIHTSVSTQDSYSPLKRPKFSLESYRPGTPVLGLSSQEQASSGLAGTPALAP